MKDEPKAPKHVGNERTQRAKSSRAARNTPGGQPPRSAESAAHTEPPIARALPRSAISVDNLFFSSFNGLPVMNGSTHERRHSNPIIRQ